MVLRPETDPETGELRLVGDDFPENVTFFPGELGVFSQGAFLRGGNDIVQGSSDPELVRGNQDNDQLFGGGGDDTLLGGQDNDRIQGQAGNDLIFGEKDEDVLFGGEGEDTIFGGLGNDEANGGKGDDIFFGGFGSDQFNGDAGDDLIQGENDGDFLLGGLGNDVILGGLGPDQISGDGGEDIIRGEQDNDFLAGGEENDLIFGGQGNDRILGEGGSDQLYADKGQDTLVGGEGEDTFFIQTGTGGSTADNANFIFDFSPDEDTLTLVGDFPFETLRIIEDPRNSNNTLIQAATGEFIAVLQQVRPDAISRSNFFISGLISFSSDRFSVSENGTAINPITVTRTAGDDGSGSVTLVRSPVGEQTPSKIDFSPSLISFEAGDETPKIVNINIVDDEIVDYSNEVLLTLENPTGVATLGVPTQAILEIIDDDPKPEPFRTIANPFPEAFSGFGTSVASLGNNLIIGAPGQQNYQGIAYLFDSNTGQLIQNFNHPFPATAGSAKLGQTVAAFGADIVIGAPEDSTVAPNTGAVYLFSSSAGVAFQRLNNPTPDPFDNFGFAVDSIATNVIVGAPTDSTLAPRTGIAYLFDGISGELLQTFNNPNPKIDSSFGASVAVVGDKVLIGAPGSLNGEAGTQPGFAYLFESSTGELLQTFSNPNPGIDDFGRSLLWTGIGRDILIGAPGDDTRGSDTGGAFLFDGITGAVLQSYTYPNPRNSDRFGESLAIIGTDVLVGTPGYGALDFGGVFQYQLRSGDFVQTYINTRPSEGDTVLNFGASIATVGNTWVTGVPDYDINAPRVGQVDQFF